jgi:hypothetical protein
MTGKRKAHPVPLLFTRNPAGRENLAISHTIHLTNHRWMMLELLRSQVPLPAWVAPKCRGRPPKRARQPAMAVAT